MSDIPTSTINGGNFVDAKYPSKERVERDGYLVYAEGDDIPETDTEELARQGYTKAEPAPANKSRKASDNK